MDTDKSQYEKLGAAVDGQAACDRILAALDRMDAKVELLIKLVKEKYAQATPVAGSKRHSRNAQSEKKAG